VGLIDNNEVESNCAKCIQDIFLLCKSIDVMIWLSLAQTFSPYS